jgi:hypothetical protein
MPTTTPRIERRTLIVPTPAAGGEVLLTPTGQGPIQVLSFRLVLTSSAAAGARVPVLSADDATSTFWQAPGTPEQEPSSVASYCWYPGVLVGGGDTTGPTEANATGAAAAAGSAALPAGAYITGFQVDFQAPTAAIAGQITITNVQGGTLTYDVQQELTLPTTVRDNYAGNGLPAVAAGSVITVNIPAMVGGGAWSLVVTGTISAGAPRTAPLPREGLHLKRGYRLRTTTFGLDVADQYSSIVAYIQEFYDAPDFQSDPTVPTYFAELDS